MTQPKYLIVNADDFGQSNGINLGIMDAFENGIVTSASLMVRWPSAEAAACYARKYPKLSVGLHVDLGEWAYRQGQWISLYEVVPRDDSAAVTEEAHRQLSTFEISIITVEEVLKVLETASVALFRRRTPTDER